MEESTDRSKVAEKRQISPFGVILNFFSSDGVLLKLFIQGGSFGRKLHAWSSKSPMGLAGLLLVTGLATVSGDMHMFDWNSPFEVATCYSKGNRQFG